MGTELLKLEKTGRLAVLSESHGIISQPCCSLYPRDIGIKHNTHCNPPILHKRSPTIQPLVQCSSLNYRPLHTNHDEEPAIQLSRRPQHYHHCRLMFVLTVCQDCTSRFTILVPLA